MSTRPHKAIARKILLAGIFLALVFSYQLKAEPYLAFKNNLFCSACHVNPIGGGERNSFGTYYGTAVLPQTPGSLTQFDVNNINDGLRIGANFRANYTKNDQDQGNSTQTFETQSGQIYFLLQPKDSRMSLYIDEQVLPGSAQTREAFILTKLNEASWLKIGKLMLPYGIRLEDDTAFIRQASGFNFTNSDNGVEWDHQTQHWFFSTAVSNGSSTATNTDKGLSYLGRAEYLGSFWRLGVSGVYNNADVGARTQANIFAGLNWLGFTFLAEADHIQDKSIHHLTDTTQQQRIGFFEINRELMKGINLKLTTEYFDPETHVAENQRTKNSLVVEYTPFANLQIRSGVRRGEDIPQRVNGNFWLYFTQAHFYF